jgi:ParB family chromosome partitioning protein
MLGKGLESLIPPHRNGNGSGQAPQKSDDQSYTSLQPDDDSQDFDYATSTQGAGNQSVPPAKKNEPHFSPLPSNDADPQPFSIFMLHEEPQPAVSHVEPQSAPSTKASFVSRPVPPPVRQNPRPTGDTRSPGESPLSRSYSDEDHIFHIEVDKIKPNPNQPRRNFSEEGILELAASIREFGFLQPLVLTKIDRETPYGVEVEYQLIAGERRLLAAKKLGLSVAPAIIRHINLEREKLELAVIENIQREGLNPIETARAFARLQDEFRMTQREIAAKLGKSREVVANTVRLLSLPIYIQEDLERGKISESHGRLLLTIDDPGAQKKLFDDILSQGMTTRELKLRVDAAKPRKERSGTVTAAFSPAIRMMEEKLSSDLGTPVKIEKNAGTGKIVISFYSEEELENIVHKIGKE